MEPLIISYFYKGNLLLKVKSGAYNAYISRKGEQVNIDGQKYTVDEVTFLLRENELHILMK